VTFAHAEQIGVRHQQRRVTAPTLHAITASTPMSRERTPLSTTIAASQT
jgi:hypothetical protein